MEFDLSTESALSRDDGARAARSIADKLGKRDRQQDVVLVLDSRVYTVSFLDEAVRILRDLLGGEVKIVFSGAVDADTRAHLSAISAVRDTDLYIQTTEGKERMPRLEKRRRETAELSFKDFERLVSSSL